MPIKYEQGVLVTPSQARQWLDRNADENRGEKKAKIPGYARDMLAGRWDSETGETLKFDEDGWLLDGQNRLRAVIMAKKSVRFDIAWGLKRSAMPVLDSGSARTAADALKVSRATDTPRTASIIRWVILWDAGFYTGRGGTLNPTKPEISERFAAEPGMFDAAARRAGDCAHRRLCNSSASGVAHYLFSRINGEYAHQFFDQFIAGTNTTGGKSPVWALRERLRVAKIDRITPSEQLALFCRAWNAWRKDKPIEPRYLIISRGELGNANFPQPK